MLLNFFNNMQFVTVQYMVFLPLAALLYYNIRQDKKNWCLLLISYFFYAQFGLSSVPFLMLSTAVSYYGALMLEKSEDKKRKLILIFVLLVNIGMLLGFKYFNFFIENIVSLFITLGIPASYKKLNLWLITGISYFTFQSVSYIIDVYLHKVKPEKSLVVYSLYLSFFPHVLSGPISRADKLIPQFYLPRRFEYSNAVTALQLMAIGYFKKIAVADILGLFISSVHKDLPSYSGLMLIFTAFAYSIQLYCDFSGYSDIARGTAKLLGFDIIDNFNTPYISTSFSQFWSKWHISLSSWFQDYIFTPFVWTNPLKKLGATKPPIIIAIWLVFLTSGLWHGSAWTFIIWGALHALYRTSEDLMRKYYKKPDKRPKPLKYWSKVAWVFTLVTFSQIFFSAKSVSDALYYISHLFYDLSPSSFFSSIYKSVFEGFDKTPILIYGYIIYCVLAITVVVFMDFYRHLKLKGQCLTTIFITMKKPYRFICYYILIAFIFIGFIMNNGGYGGASFIYLNF